MICSTTVDFLIAQKISANNGDTNRKKWLIFSLILNFSTLGVFKYFNFFADSLSAALNTLGVHNIPLPLIRILLPPGISFYTFQEVAYIVDVYKGRLQPAKSFIEYGLFVSLFPHLIAGPIQRPGRLLPQVQTDRSFDADRFFDGVMLIFSGLVRKCVIADNCALLANAAFGGQLGGPNLWVVLIGTYAFAWQVHGDFSGYSDIARGSAQLLGFPGGGTLAFAMMANGNAKFVEIDAAGGHGTVGSGTMEKTDTTAYNTSQIAGDYAFGMVGLDGSNNRTAIAGRFTANGAGTFTNGASDVNQSGLFTTWNLVGANYIVTDTVSGRGIMNLPPLAGGVPTNLNFIFYIVNAGKLFAMETDAVTIATPLLNGVVLQQQSPTGGFSSASLSGGMVIYLTGRAGSGCGGGIGPASNVLAGLLSANGVGGLNLTYGQNCGGAPTSTTGLLGTYSLASNGRTAIRVGTNYLVAYLVSSNQAIFIVPDSSVLFGFGEPQAPVSFTNSTVKGTYAGSTTTPATLGVGIFSGEFTADGASPTGNITGIEDIGAPSGASTGVAANATFTVASTPTNGRGTIAGSVGGNGIMYIVSPSKFVVVSLNDLNPAVLIFEQ